MKFRYCSLVFLLLLLSFLEGFTQQTVIIDNFEDDDLITDNWYNWRVFCYPQNNDGYVQVFKNDTDGSTKAVHARFNNGTGSWTNSAIQLKFGGLGGLDMRRYKQIRFKAKGAAYPIELRLEAQPVTDYSFYRTTTASLSSVWQQFTITLDSLKHPGWGATSTGAITLDSCLKHAWAFDFNIMAPPGSTTDLWIDEVELITNPAYQAPAPPVLPSALKQAAQGANIELGFAMSPDYIGDSLVREITRLNGLSITSEWGPVMAEIKRYPDRYDFSMADATIKWAFASGLKVKGEHLIWHLSDPDWIKNVTYTTAQYDSVFKEYIQTTINYFKTNYPGLITHWSVVNEAIDDNTHTYRNTFWYQKLGQDYIAKAFTYARQADPNVKLYYNDYNADGLSVKADSMYNILKRLKQQGVPIDGVGLQMHVSLENFPGKAAVLSNMNRLGALGLEVYVTEIDVAINEDQSGVSVPKFPQQAQVYCDVLEACIESPYCKDYTIWGITDRYSWYEQFFKKKDWPLITDYNYQPKEAWNCIYNTLRIATALEEGRNSSESFFYPNPATDRIIVELKENSNVFVYNILGVLIMQLILQEGSNEINVSTLPGGIYMVRVEGGRQQKFVKK